MVSDMIKCSTEGYNVIVGDKMNHSEVLILMATPEWSEPMPE